jgi:hypothetical protein
MQRHDEENQAKQNLLFCPATRILVVISKTNRPDTMDKETYKKTLIFVVMFASILINAYLIDERQHLKKEKRQAEQKAEKHQDVAWDMYKKYRKLKATKCYKDIVR